MEYIVTAQEMRSYDMNTITDYGVESLVLMERAGDSVCKRIIRHKNIKKVLVLCGSGNNGGDGFVIGRILHTKGYEVKILFVGSINKMTPETSKQYQIVTRYGIPVEVAKDSRVFLQEAYDCIVDALFGISLSRPIEGIYAEVIGRANAMGGFKIAVDIPSGICPDTGMIFGCAFFADETVTFGFKKAGGLLGDGKEYCGKVVCTDIGITKESFLGNRPAGFSYNKSDLPLIPRRRKNSHKGSNGKVLLIAGSRDIGGACVLSALSLYRCGCGYVKVLTHEKNRDLVMRKVPEAVVSVYGDNHLDLKVLKAACDFATVLVIGPGIGKTQEAKKMIEYVLSKTSKPLLIDADAINLISDDVKLQELLKNRDKSQPVILTPHLVELKRLSKIDTQEYKRNILKEGFALANQYHCILVSKDAATIVFDGRKEQPVYFINQSGNDGLATAGSGDVLAGIIGGLLGKGMDGMEAACMGVFLHGICADELAKHGSRSYMKPTDIIKALSRFLE